MNKNQFNDLLDKYLKGKSSGEEDKLLHEFYDSFQKNDDWGSSGLPEQGKMEGEILKGINKRIDDVEGDHKKNRQTVYLTFMKVAASIAFIVVLSYGFIFYQDTLRNQAESLSEKSTQAGQKSTLVLSDGTYIRLNSESKLTFPKKFGKHSREVTLIGEAYFDVARNEDKPFVITSEGVSTKVLGTSFNISAFPNEQIEVTVATGEVQVSPIENQTVPDGAMHGVNLKPNQQGVFYLETGVIEKKDVDINKYLSWKDDVIQFNEIKLRDATTILERWYGVAITFENEDLGSCKKISGKYSGENLINILKSFQYILGIDYEMVNANQIVIKGKC